VPLPLLLRTGAGPAVARALGASLLALFCGYQLQQLATDRFNVKQGDSNQFGIGVARQRYPEGGTRLLEGSGVRGPMFNSSEAGSYLIARGFDVFIDPRGDVYQDGWIDTYRRIVADPAEADRAIERFGLRVFFLETDMTRLIAQLSAKPDWRIVYADAVTTILLRRDAAPQLPAVDLAGERWWTELRSGLPEPASFADAGWTTRVDSPKPYLRLARLCLTLGAYRPARLLFEDALSVYPPGFTDYEPLGHAAERSGDPAAAARYYGEALRRDPGRDALRKRLAFAHLREGAHELAVAEIERFLGRRPGDAEALALRGDIELALGRPEAAATWLERAIAAAPREGLYHYYHGRLMLRLGRSESARVSFETAFRLDPTHLETALDLVELCLAQADFEAARTWLERARALAPADPRVRAAGERVPGA